jgi:hypothetical protein
MTTLTKQDVFDAAFAESTIALAQSENDTIEGTLRGLLETNQQVAQALAEVNRGRELLKTYRVVYGPRSTVDSRFSADDLEKIVSPIVYREAGYTATNPAHYAMALVAK